MVHEEHAESLLEVLSMLVAEGEMAAAVALLLGRHPADQADLVEHLEVEAQVQLVAALTAEQEAPLLEYLPEDVRVRLLRGLPATELVELLDLVEPDVAVDVAQELPREQVERVVPLLEDREEVEELLAYGEDTAGGRMSTDVVALRRIWTVEEAISHLRRQQPDERQPFYLYVVDDEESLLGIVNPRSIITAPPETPIAAITDDEGLISVHVDEDQEVAAERLRHYNLLALPVIDRAGRLAGVITADDVIDIQTEEATEDIFHLAGLPDEERIFRPVRQAAPPRLGWLLLNLVAAFAAAAMVNFFEGTIERVAVLAAFMPMVAGMGGNAGLQTLTLVVRSIALGEVQPRDGIRVIKHEALIALLNGVIIGVLVGVVAWLWKDNAWLGVIVGLALTANICNAAFGGVLIPMTLKRLRLDPALGSGMMVMFSDVLGFLLFLGLATLLVSRLT